MSLTPPHALDDNIIDVYLLAAPAEEDECIAIQKHLKPIIRNSSIPIQLCSDFDNLGGSVIAEQKERLLKADVVLALISVDFIDDEETYERTQKVIERSNRNETILIPILVRNCMWKSTPFVNLPLLPKNFQPLNNTQFWNSQDDAFMAVVEDIYAAIKEFSYVAPEPTARNASTANIQTPEDLMATVAQTETIVDETNEGKSSPTNGASEAKLKVVELDEGIEQDKAEMPDIAVKSNRNSRLNNRAPAVAVDVDWRKGYYKKVMWKRAFAFVLDAMLFPVFWGISLFIVLLIDLTIDATTEESDDIGPIIISLCLYLIFCAALESSKLRGSIGKRLMRIQITNRAGNPISFFRALWRNVLKSIFAFLYIVLFPFQIWRFNKTKRLFHDELSNTVIGERLTAR